MRPRRRHMGVYGLIGLALAFPQGAGLAVGWDSLTAPQVAAGRPAFVIDYHPAWNTDCLHPQHGVPPLPGVQHLPMAWAWMPLACLRAAAAAQPGSWWILGNEPNWPGQDACGTPGQCAASYTRQKTAILQGDPTARFLSPGLAEAGTWWAGELERDGRIFDGWTIHLYAGWGGPAYVAAKVAGFRAWQAARGDRRPVLVGELGNAAGWVWPRPALAAALGGLPYAWFVPESGTP